MTKKILYITLIIIGIVIIGWLAWYLIFKPSPVTTPESAGFTTSEEEAAAKKLSRISGAPVISAHFNNDNSISFYDLSGKLWQSKIGDSQPMPTDQSAIKNPADAIWSASGMNIVKAGLNQLDIDYIFSNFNKKISADLRADIKSIAFSPDESKIAYYVSNKTSVNSLYTSTPDGNNQKTLIGSFKLRDIDLSWPKNTVIGITSKPSGLTAGKAWTLNTATLGTTKLLDGSTGGFYGLETLWSPNGDNFIYSYVDERAQNPKLAVYKNNASKIIENISTIINKCAWAEDSINVYCAIPQSWPAHTVLPDDYYKNAFLTADDIWKINTETGEKNIIFKSGGDIANIRVNPENTSLIFIFKNNNFLYKLDLN